jgi:uncharacterized protein (TIGR02598 family)
MTILIHPKNKGFSLVEVVIALGVVSVAIVSILGLLSVLMLTDRESSADSSVAAMATEVIAELRSMPFSELQKKMQTQPIPYYFREDGSPQDSISTDTLYRCNVTGTLSSSATSYQLLLTFKWPYNAVKPSAKQLQVCIGNKNQ